MVVRWLTTGTVDYLPTNVFDHCPKLLALYRAVGGHPGVKAWLAKSKGVSSDTDLIYCLAPKR
jgi:hypothetical protein